MKKILALMLTILLLTIAFISCNLDGTTGIFRDVAQSKAPLLIQYKQLLGINGTDLYFMTAEGVQRVSNLTYSSTPVVSSKYENIIQAAALSSSGNEVFYYTNNVAERDANQIRVVNTANLSPLSTITVTKDEATSVFSDLSIKGLYANSMILVTGKDDNVNKVFQLLEYDGTTFGTSVAQSTLPDTGYGLVSVIQQTAKEQDATAPMIVSFVKNIDSAPSVYKHYLIAPSIAGPATPIPLIGFDDVTIANFMQDSSNDKIYILTTNGILYYAGTLTTPVPKVEMKASGETYGANAFAYGLSDAGITEFHLITKPSTKTSSLYVFTFSNSATDNTGVSIAEVKTGYATELSLVTIVCAQEKSTDPSKLLVATDENGMFDITINPATANVNNDTNGLTSEEEEYTF